jgi:hypothetical protein
MCLFSNSKIKDEIRTMRVDLSTYQQEISLLKDDNNKWKDRFQTVLNKYGVRTSTIFFLIMYG